MTILPISPYTAALTVRKSSSAAACRAAVIKATARRLPAINAAQRAKKRPGVLKTVVVLAFTVVFALLAVQMLEQERILRRQKERIADLQRQYDSLLTQIDDINREVELAGSSSYIEHYLREKLGMIKKGETLYKIVPDESSAP